MTTTNTTKLTAETITNKQIRDLCASAGQHDDPLTVELCDIALGVEDSDGTGTILGVPCTVEQAKANLAEVINAARAMED